ncbi:MAG: hypothetical protein AAB853_01185 [Patescibacteria group bacterium]
MSLLSFLFALVPLLLSFPDKAIAQVGALPGLVDGVVGTMLPTSFPGVTLACPPLAGSGACELAALFVHLVQRGRLLIGAAAFLLVVIAGFRLIISQSEEALTTARRTILGVVVGLFLVFLSEPLVEALYGGFGTQAGTVLIPGNTAAATGVLSDELLGIMRWVETIIAIVVIGLLVVQAVAVLGSLGNEETIRKAYRAIGASLAGILLIVFDETIAAIFGFTSSNTLPGNPSTLPFFVEVFGFLRFILMFVAVIIVGIILYAAALMLLNFGNEELVTRSKSILTNAAIGLVLIILSFALVSTVILQVT